jgi:hypothetical protein
MIASALLHHPIDRAPPRAMIASINPSAFWKIAAHAAAGSMRRLRLT